MKLVGEPLKVNILIRAALWVFLWSSVSPRSGVLFDKIMKNPTAPITGKTCPDCLLPKLATDFNLHGGHRDGLSTRCKSCLKQYLLERRVSIKKAAASHSNVPILPTIRSIKPPTPSVAPIEPELVIDVL
jgi:hypothetical protein